MVKDIMNATSSKYKSPRGELRGERHFRQNSAGCIEPQWMQVQEVVAP